jgi:hypothetical protein
VFAGQAFEVFRCGGGDDAVVSADLGIVPCPRATLRFQMTLQRFKARVSLAQRC